MAASDLAAGCASLPLYPYTRAEQLEMLAEKNTLPPSSIIRSRVLPEYSRTRDAIRACRGDPAT